MFSLLSLTASQIMAIKIMLFIFTVVVSFIVVGLTISFIVNKLSNKTVNKLI